MQKQYCIDILPEEENISNITLESTQCIDVSPSNEKL